MAAAGAPVPPGVPPAAMPGFQFELTNFAGKIRALSVVWFIYGGLSMALGFAALAFADAFVHGRLGYWMHGPMPPMWFGPAILHFAWMFIVLRTALALVAGWGLMERAPWGRIVAIVAAILNLVKFPFGTALGIWTLVMLLGYRNATLYDQLPQ
ncbi:MAG TPA: hypothetical protein VG267_03855 [Terracidiphilus sp.]|nr:hypothetical protein [Terracidiphilus sp.]